MNSPLPMLRLADRYPNTKISAWRTVHYDKPVSFNEMKSLYGTSWVIKQELMIWVKVFAKCVMLISFPIFLFVALGLIIYRKKIIWKNYLLAFIFMFEPLFSALYWRQETRYLWPVYPCLILLAALLMRDFYFTNETKNTSESRFSFKTLANVLLTASLIVGLISAVYPWRDGFRQVQAPVPGWVDTVLEIPEGSIIITNNPWSVAWHSERYAVMCPISSHDDMLEVLQLYKPDYYLNTGKGFRDVVPSFNETDIQLINHGEKEDWKFYKVLSPNQSD